MEAIEQKSREELIAYIKFLQEGKSNPGHSAIEPTIQWNEQIFKALLDGIEDVIYVSDPGTYEIVHVNHSARRCWGDNMVGKKCYKALQNRDTPCPFCTNHIIFNEKPGETYIWEFQNEVNKHWYRCADKAIDWPDGRKLRFELASDITLLITQDEQLKAANQQLAAGEQQLRLLNQELDASNQQLDASNQQLAAYNQQLETSEQELKNLSFNLGERLKEMECMYSITDSIANRIFIDDVFHDSLSAIQKAWQFPDITAVRIINRDKEYVSANFRETKWKINADIFVDNENVGCIEVFYLKRNNNSSENIFLKEEKLLLEKIASTLGNAIKRKKTDEALKLTNEQLAASEEQVRAANQQLIAANQQLEASEEQIRENMNQFRSLLNGIEDVIYVSDPNTYEIVHVNDTAENFWGSNILGQKCYKVLQNRNSPCPFCTNDIIFNQKPGQTHVWEFQNEVNKHWFRCADKTIDWPDGRKLRFELASDITELKTFELALKESEEKFRLLTENASEMIYLMNINNGIYEYVSPASDKLFGYKPDDFYRDPSIITKMIHPDWHEYFRKEWGKLNKGILEPFYEYQIVHSSGETRWIHQGNTLINSDDGTKKILGVVSDITRQKADENQLSKLNQELKAKTEELQQILYITTHDLRSPLVNIQGFSKELEASVKELTEILESTEIPENMRVTYQDIVEEELPESIHFITSSITKMDQLLKGLLKISRLGRQKMHFVPLNMNKLLKEASESLEYESNQNKIQINIDDVPDCFGDEIQINQLFSNLMENAIKFMHPDRPGKIHISGKKGIKFVKYTVEDNGIGIAKEHQKKVFELFHKLNPQKPGSGLGMNIVKQIIEKHNGKIELSSEMGKGSSISVFLPLTDTNLKYL